MRVIECNVCGETLSADNDDELVGRLVRHMQSQHSGVEFNDDEAREVVDDGAYSATDS
jgi:predicted small metal-binding protein